MIMNMWKPPHEYLKISKARSNKISPIEGILETNAQNSLWYVNVHITLNCLEQFT